MSAPAYPPVPALRAGWRCVCPQCGEGKLYKGFLSVAPTCSVCGLDLSAEDSGDGPAVFIIFFLGFLITPIAIIVGFQSDWPVWLHMLVWGGLTIGGTLLTLRPLKAFTIALQYKHRRQDGQKL